MRRLRWLLLAVGISLMQGCTHEPGTRAAAPAPAATPSFHQPAPGPATPAPKPLATRLAALAEDADPHVIALAVRARGCAIDAGDVVDASRLTVIDYSRPSTEPRLWVFDLPHERLLYREHVAHGRNTGENLATRFSNTEGSLQTSLGLFRTAETYVGGNGYSLRMDGLEPGINDLARPRAIVMHGAPYVDPTQALRQGRLGRSLGCPALRPQVARALIDTIRQGQLVFAYYPDAAWLGRSRFLSCRDDEPQTVATAPIHATPR